MAGPLHVLLVEDLEDDARLLLLELKRGGWEVTHQRVDNAAAMIRALESHQWDIIISDYSMPGFSGIAALNIARQRAADLPFILISGTVGEETAVAAMKAGADDYLFKGNLKRLTPAIERELREASLRREARQVKEQLKLSEKQLAEAHRIANLGAWRIDSRSGKVIWADETFRILGLEPGSVTPTVDLLLDRIHPEDRLLLAGVINSPDIHRVERDIRIIRRDGELRYVHMRIDVTRSDDAVDIVGTIQDITDRKIAEQELRRAHDELTVAKNSAEAATGADAGTG
jgi:PAS domain S-box-containing protein